MDSYTGNLSNQQQYCCSIKLPLHNDALSQHMLRFGEYNV